MIESSGLSRPQSSKRSMIHWIPVQMENLMYGRWWGNCYSMSPLRRTTRRRKERWDEGLPKWVGLGGEGRAQLCRLVNIYFGMLPRMSLSHGSLAHLPGSARSCGVKHPPKHSTLHMQCCKSTTNYSPLCHPILYYPTRLLSMQRRPGHRYLTQGYHRE